MENRFDFQIEKVVEEIKKRKAKKILLQFPEGIKQDSLEVVKELRKNLKSELIVSGESAWGGCDIAVEEAKVIEADLIVHFGHAPFIKSNFPIVYVYVKDKKDLTPLLEKSLKELKKDYKIGIVSAIQHIHSLKDVKSFYEKNEKKIFVPRASGFAYLPGHVVGCEYSGLKQIKNEIDSVVVIGNRFHALGAALALPDKKILLLDSYNWIVESMDKFRELIMKQRYASIDKMKRAKKIGIVVGLKPGQCFGNAEILKKEFEKKDKEVLIITMREISPDKLFNFYNLDGFVELACPRIAVDDYGKYEKPVITFKEALVVLGKMSGEELMERGFV